MRTVKIIATVEPHADVVSHPSHTVCAHYVGARNSHTHHIFSLHVSSMPPLISGLCRLIFRVGRLLLHLTIRLLLVSSPSSRPLTVSHSLLQPDDHPTYDVPSTKTKATPPTDRLCRSLRPGWMSRHCLASPGLVSSSPPPSLGCC